MSRATVTREYLLTVLQTRTQADAALYLGIGERTIRRIKNLPDHKTSTRVESRVVTGGKREHVRLARVGRVAQRKAIRAKDVERFVEESEALETAIKKLQRLKVSPQKIAQFKRLHKPRPTVKQFRGGTRMRIPSLPVTPPFERRTRVDPDDTTRRRRLWVDALSYDVRGMEIPHIVDMLTSYARLKTPYLYHITFGAPADAIYDVFSDTKRERKTFVLDGKGGTEWEPINGLKRDDFVELLTYRLLRDERGRHNFLQVHVQKLQKGGEKS